MLHRHALVLAMLLAALPSHAQAPPTLAEITQAIDAGRGDTVEAALLKLHAGNPQDAEIMTQLARLEYVRAVAGRSQPRNGESMNWDRAGMEAAEKWATQAVEADPDHANALIALAQVHNARSEPGKSLELLERAEALDPSSLKLRLRKGEALRTMAAYHRDPSFLPASAREFQRVIQGDVDTSVEVQAASELAIVYELMGEPEKALAQLAPPIEAATGNQQAFALEKRARLHLEAGDVDASLADSRAALELMNFPLAVATLADGLLVRAGLAMRNIGVAPTIPHLAEFARTGRSPVERLHILAGKKTTFPAVYALLTPQMKALGFDQAVPKAIGEAASFITADELKRLKAMGVSFDTPDVINGTLLHRAVAANNVQLVRDLIELGADVSVPLPSGMTTLQSASSGTSPERREIRRLLQAATGTESAGAQEEVDLPVPGRWYRAERTIGVANGDMGKVFEKGMTLLAGDACATPEVPTICFSFYTRPGQYYATILVPIADIQDFKALREVEAPP